jgi:hypothetical protein
VRGYECARVRQRGSRVQRPERGEWTQGWSRLKRLKQLKRSRPWSSPSCAARTVPSPPHCHLGAIAIPFSNLTHTADSCGYQKAGTGICNSTVFGYPMDGFANILADVPTSYKTTTTDLITSDTFIDANYNHGMSRAGSLLIFVSARGARARQELVTVTSSCFPRLSSLPS